MGNCNPFDPFDEADGLEACFDEAMLMDDTDEMDRRRRIELGLEDDYDLY